MRKRYIGKKLSRSRSTRDALYRSLVRALFDNGKIVTTMAKAMGVKPSVEKIIKIADPISDTIDVEMLKLLEKRLK